MAVVADRHLQGLGEALEPYTYTWPDGHLDSSWRRSGDTVERLLPERVEDLLQDSRWPAFFPSPISFVTTAAGGQTGLEKVVGASLLKYCENIL